MVKINIMAYYAMLNENNFVINIKTSGHESDWDGEIGWFNELGIVHKRTSYNTRGGVHYTNGIPSQDQSKAFRKNYAGIGYYYDSIRDAFIAPKPFPSWTLNEESCLWDSPVPYPNDGKMYTWNEDILNWQLINQEQ